jgi:hypothetical protein
MLRFSLIGGVVVLLASIASVAEAGHGGYRPVGGAFGGGIAYRSWGGVGPGFGVRPGWGVGRGIGMGPGWGRGFGVGPGWGWGRSFTSVNVAIGRPGLWGPGYGWGGGWGGYGWPYRSYGWGGFYGGGLYGPVGYRSVYVGPAWGYSPYYYSPIYYRPVYYQPSFGYPIYYDCHYPGGTTLGATELLVSRDIARPASALASTPITTRSPSRTITSTRSSVDLLARSRRLIRLGDESFGSGRYRDALSRYRDAAMTSPELAEVHFRKGHAYLANGQLALAADAFRRGLALEPTAHRDGFRLSDLYGDDTVARDVHLENLAAEALMKEESADAYFLLGMMLHFDGDSARADKFFAKAVELSPDTGAALAALRSTSETPVSVKLSDGI